MSMPHLKHVTAITDAQKKLLLFPSSAEVERVATVIVWSMAKRIREARRMYFNDPDFRRQLESSKLMDAARQLGSRVEERICKRPAMKK